jgi:hypothetical protein
MMCVVDRQGSTTDLPLNRRCGRRPAEARRVGAGCGSPKRLGVECSKQRRRKKREETVARPRVLDGGAVVVYVGTGCSQGRAMWEEEGETRPRRPVLNRSRGTK